ncbi:MAG TPA: hypothetical protein VLS49_15325 [Usitatibacter sp.]|nr:hypothetical protein [Usitatibacter sp.]
MRRFIAAVFTALALPVAAQVAPAADYSDLWYLPSESGWGVSFRQHAGTNQVFAVWFTYDPREADPAQPGRNKPLWIVMPGGTWTSPTSLQGTAYVTDGNPFSQGGALRRITAVGTFLFQFSGTSNGIFTYQISPPAGLAPDDPAYGLPSFTGSKSITRQPF